MADAGFRTGKKLAAEFSDALFADGCQKACLDQCPGGPSGGASAGGPAAARCSRRIQT
jgi:hypothetical protein